MDAKWLNKQFELYPDKSKAGLARVLGLEPPAVSKILKGTRQIKAKEYALMQQYFGQDTHVSQGDYDVPYANDAQDRSTVLEDPEPTFEEDWVIPASVLSGKSNAAPEKVKVFQITDHLMEPAFKKGEYVLVDLSQTVPSPPGYFIVSDGYGHFARQCEMIMEKNAENVRVSAKDKGFSPQVLRLDELDIVGRVIARLRWL